jgi:hypothetical protein
MKKLMTVCALCLMMAFGTVVMAGPLDGVDIDKKKVKIVTPVEDDPFDLIA